jgi:hypothetical protein
LLREKRLQIPPLRFAPVGMTKERVVVRESDAFKGKATVKGKGGEQDLFR